MREKTKKGKTQKKKTIKRMRIKLDTKTKWNKMSRYEFLKKKL